MAKSERTSGGSHDYPKVVVADDGGRQCHAMGLSRENAELCDNNTLAALHSRPLPLVLADRPPPATELLAPKDPFRTQPDLFCTMGREKAGLHDHHVFERCQIPKSRHAGFNILRSCYVLACKDAGTIDKFAKARLDCHVMRRLHRDYGSLLTDAPTVAKTSFHLLVTVTASHDLPLATWDVTRVYVCTTHPFFTRCTWCNLLRPTQVPTSFGVCTDPSIMY